MITFKAPWDSLLIGVSTVSTLICLGSSFGLGQYAKNGHLVLTGVSLLLVALVIGSALFTVRGYTVTPQAIQVHRLFWNTRLSRAELRAARVEPDAMRGSVRLCGNGGFFSYTGFYRNSRLGNYRAWVTDRHRTVVLQFARCIVVVSPDRPEEFVGELELPAWAKPQSAAAGLENRHGLQPACPNLTESAFPPGGSQPKSPRSTRTIVPALALSLVGAGYLILVEASEAWLPARVATHFGAGGKPDGWMPRSDYLHLVSLLGLVIAGLMVGLALMLGIVRHRLAKAQSRPGAPARPPTRNLSWLSGDVLWLGVLVLGFLAGTHYLTILANRNHPVQLPKAPFIALLAAFSLGMLGWVALLILHLTRPFSPRTADSRSGAPFPSTPGSTQESL